MISAASVPSIAALVVASLIASPTPPPGPEAPAPVGESSVQPQVREGSADDPENIRLQLDAAALWGIGGQMLLGGHLRLAALFEHWSTSRAFGTWDLGLAFAYHNEPTFLAPWLDRSQVDGAGHRILSLGHLGHTVHMGRRRRAALGLHVYGGWNVWRSDYSLRYPDEGVEGSAVVVRHRAIVGGELRFTYRLHEHLGLNLMLGAPAPTTSSYLITLLHVGAGLTFYLHGPNP